MVWQNLINKHYQPSFLAAIALHLFIFVFIFYNLGQHTYIIPHAASSEVEPIQASAVEARVVEQHIANIQAEKQRRIDEQIARQRKAEEARLAKQREAEEARLAKQREKALAEKRQAEQKRQEALAKQRAEEEAANRARAERERQTQLEAERQRQQRLAAEAKARQREMDNIVAHYQALIRDTVQGQWYRPDTRNMLREATVLVNLAPNGLVIRATIQQSSGDSMLDESIITAIHSASPLPVPNEITIFNQFFRRFTFSTEILG